ncbi:3-phosphoshikimate 1-carboxyvinyltransferase [Zeaxanthinibacter enoshimensis]|uniref:3-phosphoshikimate 1-carboxyvinyltransferase n=1 Tax=Zeaxanthinibacter enoshimensis TaxID=392009 RepID=A0A4R6TLT4_9FLAO|nr:3-phosphoshikimate 1-carboxyvinyltransferase [Zeaxanthinibacter enoshimensis]TDQ30659.1 3-phosphoshikimate 1-carboxyvinyltransferase [Zeaxanthinibacter enoshimensis]
MDIALTGPDNHLLKAQVSITGSKSESNRLLLLGALFPGLQIVNLSNSADTTVMQEGLRKKNGTVDIHHAGTAMRFLTAYFASQPGTDVLLTGSQRMTERPIGILVDALRSLGADISYAEKEGFPPLHIKGKKLEGKATSLPANISSQYISALLLIAPSLQDGLELELVGKITSVPYIRMTLSLLDHLGIPNKFEGSTITVGAASSVNSKKMVVESDWSSASYFYSIVALAEPGSALVLSSYHEKSLQGDSVLKEIYRDFGVETRFKGHSLRLMRTEQKPAEVLEYDLANAPDIAQTIAVTCFGLGLGCRLTGLHTLKIKETDRLVALQNELGKLGAEVEITGDSLDLKPSSGIKADVSIATYNDHRMAMAFAPLALKTRIQIADAGVVEKSYPDYWSDLQALGFGLREL